MRLSLRQAWQTLRQGRPVHWLAIEDGSADASVRLAEPVSIWTHRIGTHTCLRDAQLCFQKCGLFGVCSLLISLHSQSPRSFRLTRVSRKRSEVDFSRSNCLLRISRGSSRYSGILSGFRYTYLQIITPKLAEILRSRQFDPKIINSLLKTDHISPQLALVLLLFSSDTGLTSSPPEVALALPEHPDPHALGRG